MNVDGGKAEIVGPPLLKIPIEIEVESASSGSKTDSCFDEMVASESLSSEHRSKRESGRTRSNSEMQDVTRIPLPSMDKKSNSNNPNFIPRV